MTEWPQPSANADQPAVPPETTVPAEPTAPAAPPVAEPTAYQPVEAPTAAYPPVAYQPTGYEPAGYQPSGYQSSGYQPTAYLPSTNPGPAFAPPSYPAPAYGSPVFGSPAYGSPGYGSATYGSPGQIGQIGQAGQAGPPATGSRRSNTRLLVVVAVLAAVIAGAIGAGTVAAFEHNKTVASGISFSNAAAPNTAKIDGTVTAAAAKIQPSVVTINVAGSSESGTGSGVILRSDGTILTNNHVVAVAGTSGQIQVITSDGQNANATIVGVDASDDLAVIRVSGLTNLTAATFASSSSLQVGQTVVAVGAPLGLANTVTSGIVSNTARPVQTGDSSSTATATFDAIQTDAAINPGNSGGPLVNLNGDVVGINAAIASANSGGLQVPGQTEQSGNIGIGFSIPSDEAGRIASQLIANGKATHAVVGVSVGSAQQSTSIQSTVGATISAVTANGPAAAAGLAVGDVVTKVENQQITNGTDLVAAIRSFAPNQTITVVYTRAGTSHTVKVTLGTADS